jgi:uncharacterized protein (TIGR03663 family)
METNIKSSSWLDRPVTPFIKKINYEVMLITIILILAVVSRFYNLGVRTMSHDEVNHVVPSFDLYSGRGYAHDPVTHGPFQMHIVALTYFIFGDSDFTSRTPAALFSIAAIIFVLFGFRRYLGRNGALIAGFLFLISPFMLYYGRYTRNEGFIELFGVVQLYAMLRYLDKGDRLSLYLLTGSIVMHFITKETSFIYTAQSLLFLGLILMIALFKTKWKPQFNPVKIIILLAGCVFSFVGSFVGAMILKKATSAATAVNATTNAVPVAWYLNPISKIGLSPIQLGIILAFAIGLVLLVVLLLQLKNNIDKDSQTTHRILDMVILVGSLVLPLLIAFPESMLGWNPLDYSSAGQVRTLIMLVFVGTAAIILGLLWDAILWLKHAAMFYGIFTIFYTTFFTNGNGFFTGLVGSLGYWLSQQGVQRGGQPLYYYALIQIPIYEFLAAFGLILGLYFAIRYWRFSTRSDHSPAAQTGDNETSYVIPPPIPTIQSETVQKIESKPFIPKVPVFGLLLFWSVTSLAAYTVAGEKMPWLTVHIALPMLLASGWGLGFLVDSTPWKKITGLKQIVGIILLPVLLFSLGGALGGFLGKTPPFQGHTLVQLQATSTFLFSVIAFVGSAVGIGYCFITKPFDLILRLFVTVFFVVLAILTIRTSVRANYIDYDNGKEFIYYAHAPSGPKEVLKQVEEISKRTTKGLDIEVAYDNETLYPYWWYFRNYPNHHYYADQPTRELLNYPIVIVGEANYSKVAPILGDKYISYEYLRMVWPMMDYYNISTERLKNAITNPDMRQAIFNIWFNRDYSLYAELTNNTGLTPETWSPSNKMRIYIRKDIVSQIWDLGILPTTTTVETITDPYAAKTIQLSPDTSIGSAGTLPGQLTAPRGLAIAPDGTIYVADSRNHRIEHFALDGTLIKAWGTNANIADGDAPGGTFNEPWGIAVASDGTVFVTDTWNHRIEKFSADGTFIKMWGYFGQDGSANALYGPRGIAIDKNGRLFVTDTGNKRVVVYDTDGNYITEFGSLGTELGQLDEPVGITVTTDGKVYVVDTWNQRVQIFAPDASGVNYSVISSWKISSWDSTSTENKPFIAVDGKGHVFVTDPEKYRVLEFDSEGTYLRAWGQYSLQKDGFGSPCGIAVDAQSGVWVSDAVNSVLLHFQMPALPEETRSLPAVPAGAENLMYSNSEKALTTTSGQVVYLLDEARWSWVPLIPAELLSALPANSTPLSEQMTSWVLIGAGNAPLFRWDLTTMSWIPILPTESPSPTVQQNR